MATDPLSTGTGPIPRGALVQCWGPSGSGKTALVLSMLAPGDVLVDCEGLLPDRLAGAVRPLGRRVLVGRATDFGRTLELLKKSASALRSGRCGRVLVDGLLHHWRFERLADRRSLGEALAAVHRLREAARASGRPVVVTNQATAGPDGVPRPIGGLGIQHLSDILVRLQPLEPPWTRLHLEKHPSRAPTAHWEARIGPGGRLEAPDERGND